MSVFVCAAFFYVSVFVCMADLVCPCLDVKLSGCVGIFYAAVWVCQRLCVPMF